MASAPQSLQPQDEGTLLELSLRRAVRGHSPSAWARVKVCDQLRPFCFGGWRWQRFPAAAAVINPVAAELFASLATLHGIWIRFVQATISTLDGMESISIDCVAFRGGDRYRGGDRWWLELRWTRDPLNTDSISVQGAWSVVANYKRVLKNLNAWKLHSNLGGGPVFRPRRLGVLLVNRSYYRLEVDGGNHEVFEGSLGGVASLGPPTRPGVALLPSMVGSHEPLSKRKRPHGPRKWSDTRKAKKGRKRWRDTDHGYESHLEDRATRSGHLWQRHHATRSNTTDNALLQSTHKATRSRKPRNS